MTLSGRLESEARTLAAQITGGTYVALPSSARADLRRLTVVMLEIAEQVQEMEGRMAIVQHALREAGEDLLRQMQRRQVIA